MVIRASAECAEGAYHPCSHVPVSCMELTLCCIELIETWSWQELTEEERQTAVDAVCGRSVRRAPQAEGLDAVALAPEPGKWHNRLRKTTQKVRVRPIALSVPAMLHMYANQCMMELHIIG